MNTNSNIQYSTEDSMQNQQHQTLQQSQRQGKYLMGGHQKLGHRPEQLKIEVKSTAANSFSNINSTLINSPQVNNREYKIEEDTDNNINEESKN